MGGDVQDEAGDDPAELPTAIALIRNVVPSRRLDLAQLGWISGKRALTRSNFPANFEYVDLRGFSLADLDQALDEEGAAYAVLKPRPSIRCRSTRSTGSALNCRSFRCSTLALLQRSLRYRPSAACR